MTKKSTLGIELLRALVNAGHRIFTAADAREAAKLLTIRPGYVVEALHHLKNTHWIRSIKRGVYAITEASGFGTPPHDYEIAMALVVPSAISHWTAMSHHHLTQQTPQTIFALAPSNRKIPEAARLSPFKFVHIKPSWFFGFDQVWIGDGRVNITDPERTLLDGLMRPEYCGGIQEVLAGFEMRWPSIDLSKLVTYAARLDGAVASRTGWILEQYGADEKHLMILDQHRASGVRRLDATGSDLGSINPRWRVRENIGR